MKPLHLLFVLLLSISVASCTKGEDLEKNITVENVSPQKAKVNTQVDVTGSGFSQFISQDSSAQPKVFIGSMEVHAVIVNDRLIQIMICQCNNWSCLCGVEGKTLLLTTNVYCAARQYRAKHIYAYA
jgi:hypothetical protein